MADFKPIFKQMLLNEGGYKLHEVKNDRGGRTYAGISEKYHPDWPGWELINQGIFDQRLHELVHLFYTEKYWDLVKGHHIKSQEIAESLFDFAVNAGVKTAIRLAQVVVGATPDGIIGQQTIAALNKCPPPIFISNFALSKIARYVSIVDNDPTQLGFLRGWLHRTLRALK
jgi:lysozyme family protein